MTKYGAEHSGAYADIKDAGAEVSLWFSRPRRADSERDQWSRSTKGLAAIEDRGEPSRSPGQSQEGIHSLGHELLVRFLSLS